LTKFLSFISVTLSLRLVDTWHKGEKEELYMDPPSSHSLHCSCGDSARWIYMFSAVVFLALKSVSPFSTQLTKNFAFGLR